MILRVAISGLIMALPMAAQALNLELPSLAVQLAEKSVPKDSYFLPTAAFEDGPIDGITAEGAVDQKSWKIAGGGLTTLQILEPLRRQLEAAGFSHLFECESDGCGGFDFRYEIDLLPEPDMHVNLGDFRYLAAKREADSPEYIGLVVSRSANAGFVQLTRIGAADRTSTITASTKAPSPDIRLADLTPVGQQLETKGHATLGDLFFKTGSSQLGEQSFDSLTGLAGYLADWPDRKIVLVGHTDAEGPLDGNIVLSRKRAAAVMDRLIYQHGVSPAQVSADGVGFLAPVASNLTDEGRTQNRRVEVILRSTE